MSHPARSIERDLTEAVVLDDLSKVKQLVAAHGLPYGGYPLLLDAVKFDRTEIVEFLIQEGAEVNWVEYDVGTPLCSAVESGDVALVQKLLAFDVINVEKETPLHVAVENGNEDIVRLLLNKGALSLPDKSEFEPLHIACFKPSANIVQLTLSSYVESPNPRSLLIALLIASHQGSREIVSLLLNAGADPTVFLKFPVSHHRLPITVRCDNFPLYLACERGHLDVVKLLLEHKGMQINRIRSGYGYTPLHAAAKNGHAQVVHYLLSKHADPNIKDNCFITPLHVAAEGGYLQIVDILCKNNAKIDALSYDDSTPLLLAAKSGHPEVVKMLLYRGACVNAKNNIGHSSLYFAVENEKSTVSSCLLQLEPDIDLKVSERLDSIFYGKFNSAIDDLVVYSITTKHKGVHNFRLKCAVDFGYRKSFVILAKDFNPKNHNPYDPIPLHSAVQLGHYDTIKLLLKWGYDVEGTDWIGKTPVSYLFKRYYVNNLGENRYLDILQLLLSKGADLKKAPNLLHEAVDHKFIGICKCLIENGADVNALTETFEETPLHYIASVRTLGKKFEGVMRGDIARFLLENGASINARNHNGATPLLQAVRSGRSDVVAVLLEFKADINSGDKDARAPLHAATYNGYEDTVEILLQNRAEVDAPQDEEAQTPLHLSALRDLAKIAKLLLQFHANVNVRDFFGRTALHWAIVEKCPRVLTVLLDSGCDVNIVDCTGKTAFGYKIAGKIKTKVMKHLLKLEAAKFFINSANQRLLRKLRSDHADECNLFAAECRTEVKRMEQLALCCHLTLHDALVTPNHPAFTTNESVIHNLKSVDVNEFPIYCSLLKSGSRKNESINASRYWLNVIIRISLIGQDNVPGLPLELLLEITSYLDNNDRRSLIACGETIKRQFC